MTIASSRLLSTCLALVALFAILAPSSASAQRGDRQDRRVIIVNETGRTIQAFHATNTGTKSWGRDLLGQNVIPPGQRYLFDFDDGTGYCNFDFKAVLDNGIPIEQYRVNVCQVSTFTFR